MHFTIKTNQDIKNLAKQKYHKLYNEQKRQNFLFCQRLTLADQTDTLIYTLARDHSWV